jgi:hypothetical protein
MEIHSQAVPEFQVAKAVTQDIPKALEVKVRSVLSHKHPQGGQEALQVK